MIKSVIKLDKKVEKSGEIDEFFFQNVIKMYNNVSKLIEIWQKLLKCW